MKTVIIISHCFRYSRVLSYQISSLLLHPPERVAVAMVVVSTREDNPTQDVMSFFKEKFPTPYARLISLTVPTRELLNRSIWRNKLCKDAGADIIWLCDVDYFFGKGCIDSLADVPLDLADPEYSPLYFPRVTLYNRTHANGDDYALRAKTPGVYGVDPSDFIEHRPGRAIGGIQIVPGDVAREKGYCPDHEKWQKPCAMWKQTGADRVFRKILGTNGKAIEMPSCYRIRQTTEGVVDTLDAIEADQ